MPNPNEHARLWVRKAVRTIYNYTSLPELIAELQAVVRDNPKWREFQLEVSHDAYDGTNIEITGEREETNAERDSRLQKLAEMRGHQDKAELETYQLLKAKFEKQG